MSQYGIQWYADSVVANVGVVKWIQAPKYLIKQNNQYYTINSSYYDSVSTHSFTPLILSGGSVPDINDIYSFGFDDLSILTNSMTVESDTFIPIDKFVGSFELKMYKS